MTKFGRMIAFGRALPCLRRQIERDIRGAELSRSRVIATVVRLLDETLIRVGNEEYALQNKFYGLTTLRNQHVAVTGDRLRFHFRGKSGKEHEISVTDRRAASIVRCCRELPGQELFQYIDACGEPHSVDSADVNGYLREVAGEDFTSKDFRTWGASVVALEELLTAGPAESPVGAKKAIIEAVKRAAQRLGNTAAVCRASYIHPAVLAAYENGTLSEFAAKSVDSQELDGLSRSERRLLALLRGSQRAGA
jgi:DNA topoisomerase-1